MSMMCLILCNGISIYEERNRLGKISLIFNIDNIEKDNNRIFTTVEKSLLQIDKIQKELKRIDTPIANDVRLFLNIMKIKLNCFSNDSIIFLELDKTNEDILTFFPKLVREIEIVPEFINMIKEKKYRISKNKNELIFDIHKQEMEDIIKIGFYKLFKTKVLLIEDIIYKNINELIYQVSPLVLKIDNIYTFEEHLKEHREINLINKHYSINSKNEKFLICDYVIKKQENIYKGDY